MTLKLDAVTSSNLIAIARSVVTRVKGAGMRRLVGNPGVDGVGVFRERKTKSKRTPPSNFVLGAVVESALSEMAEAKGIKRAELVRTLILNAHREWKQRKQAE